MHKTRFSLKIHDSLKHISDRALEWSTKDQNLVLIKTMQQI